MADPAGRDVNVQLVDGQASLISPDGKPQLVPFDRAQELVNAGWMPESPDEYRQRVYDAPAETFVRNAFNTLFLGLPEVLASDAYRHRSKRLAEESPIAGVAGDITGLVGGALIPGGPMARAGAAGAKAAAGAAPMAPKVAGAVGRGVVEGAAAGAVVGVQQETRDKNLSLGGIGDMDVTKVAKEAAMSAAFGGAVSMAGAGLIAGGKWVKNRVFERAGVSVDELDRLTKQKKELMADLKANRVRVVPKDVEEMLGKVDALKAQADDAAKVAGEWTGKDEVRRAAKMVAMQEQSDDMLRVMHKLGVSPDADPATLRHLIDSEQVMKRQLDEARLRFAKDWSQKRAEKAGVDFDPRIKKDYDDAIRDLKDAGVTPENSKQILSLLDEYEKTSALVAKSAKGASADTLVDRNLKTGLTQAAPGKAGSGKKPSYEDYTNEVKEIGAYEKFIKDVDAIKGEYSAEVKKIKALGSKNKKAMMAAVRGYEAKLKDSGGIGAGPLMDAIKKGDIGENLEKLANELPKQLMDRRIKLRAGFAMRAAAELGDSNAVRKIAEHFPQNDSVQKGARALLKFIDEKPAAARQGWNTIDGRWDDVFGAAEKELLLSKSGKPAASTLVDKNMAASVADTMVSGAPVPAAGRDRLMIIERQLGANGVSPRDIHHIRGLVKESETLGAKLGQAGKYHSARSDAAAKLAGLQDEYQLAVDALGKAGISSQNSKYVAKILDNIDAAGRGIDEVMVSRARSAKAVAADDAAINAVKAHTAAQREMNEKLVALGLNPDEVMRHKGALDSLRTVDERIMDIRRRVFASSAGPLSFMFRNRLTGSVFNAAAQMNAGNVLLGVATRGIRNVLDLPVRAASLAIITGSVAAPGLGRMLRASAPHILSESEMDEIRDQSEGIDPAQIGTAAQQGYAQAGMDERFAAEMAQFQAQRAAWVKDLAKSDNRFVASRFYDALEDPRRIMARIRKDMATREDIVVLRKLFPREYASLREQAEEVIRFYGKKLTSKKRAQLGLIISPDFDPKALAIQGILAQQSQGTQANTPGGKVKTNSQTTIDRLMKEQ